ncbi:hypothetical protein SO802_021383 [Lithocarpus litseifolius]|uniref:Uncharacterized protein n=1 Tax=Lithocarpus litseifolius TaxID=425828 RepID=A0AAW2CGP9_9ROSI
MTSLRFEGPIIDLEGESSIQLGIDLLGHRYLKHIHYVDLETNYNFLKQHLMMAKVFLLFLLGAYLFANGGQTVSLRSLGVLGWVFLLSLTQA